MLSKQHAAADGAGGGGPSPAQSRTLHTILPDTVEGFLLPLQHFQCSRASERDLGALLSPPASGSKKDVPSGSSCSRHNAASLSCLLAFP